MENNTCDEGVEGVREGHCFHDIPAEEEHFPGLVCCWCGDIFMADVPPNVEHGEYLPQVYRRNIYGKKPKNGPHTKR